MPSLLGQALKLRPAASRARLWHVVSLLVAVAALATAGAGCGEGDVDAEASGDTLTVYVSVALRGESAEAGRAIVNGAKLALAEAGGQAGGEDVQAIYLDDTGDGARWDPVIVADNARRAAQDASAIAYIGELESGATRTSLPITNQAMMLHVSPGSTAVDLVEPVPGSGELPKLYQPTGERTFGRVIPDDAAQARAGARWARELGARSVAPVSDGSRFGTLVTKEFGDAADELGLRVVRTRTFGDARVSPLGDRDEELAYFGGEAGRGARGKVLGVVFGAQRAGIPFMGTDAVLTSSFLHQLSDVRAADVLATSAAQDPEQLPPLGQQFVRDYEREFEQEPNRYAAYGFEAMAVVLDSMERAADGSDRRAVIDAFLDTEDRRSVLGTYSIDAVGNTTLRSISGYRIDRGEPVFDTALEARE